MRFFPWGGGAKPAIGARRHAPMWLLGKLAARLLIAAFLVFGTYNPTGRSYYHLMRDPSIGGTWKLIASGLLVIAYGVVLQLTWRALGFGGIAMTTAFATTTTWVLIEAGWIDLASSDHAITWITLSVLAFVLGVGLCWMIIGRALDGQLRVRDITR